MDPGCCIPGQAYAAAERDLEVLVVVGRGGAKLCDVICCLKSFDSI